MKTLIKLIALTFSISHIFAQDQKQGASIERDWHGVPINFTETIESNKTIFTSPHIIETSAVTYTSVRILNEINTGDADAYPWLSADGLRLYYFQNASNNLMFTQRADTSSFFSTPVVAPIQIANGLSYWFSADELDVYANSGNNLYYAHRNSISSAFNTPIQINLNGISLPFALSISLSSDQNQLFLYSYISSVPKMLQFTRTSPTSFQFSRIVALPPGYTVGIGQLSKDDLTFYVDAKINSGTSLVYELTRSTPADSFNVNTFNLVQGINDITFFNGQPSMSADLSWVVLARASANSWGLLDLYLAHSGNIISIFDNETSQNNITMFPNPAHDKLYLNLKDYNDATIGIYDLTGHMVLHVSNTSKNTALNIEYLAGGAYVLKITSKEGVSFKKLIIN